MVIYEAYAVVLTETWLDAGILDAEININGFKLYRKDRSGQAHGGVCIYLRQDISAATIISESVGSTESLLIKIKELKLLLFVVYRPGTSTVQSFTCTMNKISQEINLAQANGQYPNICGLGDYNFPEVCWENGMLPSPTTSSSQEGQNQNILLGFMRDHLLFQMVQDPTRMKNILDLIMVNDETIVSNYSQDINVKLSDHNTILMRMKIYPGSMKKKPLKKITIALKYINITYMGLVRSVG